MKTPRLRWLLFFIVFGFSIGYCIGQAEQFVEPDFAVPDSLVSTHFKLKPLSRKYAEMDYQAVMQSIDHLKGVFGPQSEWPPKNLTLEDNQWDASLHENEFTKRKAFTYSVLSHKEDSVLGCVYIYPSSKKGYDAEIAMWVTTSRFNRGMDSILFLEVKKWVAARWPFKRIAYLGREISWEEWLKK